VLGNHSEPPAEGPRSPFYPPREDTALLRPFAASAEPGTWFLELGCGSGELALTAARVGARAVASDLNPHALRWTARRARAADLEVAPVRADLWAGLRRFRRVVANPPYLPTSPAARDPDPWQNLALDGGPDGTAVLDRILSGLAEHLLPSGRAFVLVSSRQSPGRLESLRARWRSGGGAAHVAATREWGGERLEVWELAARDPVG
jgi:release factor glutamine methyltransferase